MQKRLAITGLIFLILLASLVLGWPSTPNSIAAGTPETRTQVGSGYSIQAQGGNITQLTVDGTRATYYWQVRAIAPVPSESSNIGVFTVESQPPRQQVLPTMSPMVVPAVAAATTPLWVWLVIAVLASLVIVIIVLTMVRR